MANVPAWYPDPAESKPAPMPLLLVQAFLNTNDPDTGTDLLGDGEVAQAWFVAAGLVSDGCPVKPAELAFARALRQSIRTLLIDGGGKEPELGPLRELARKHTARLAIDDSGVLVVENPSRERLADGLFGLLLVIRAAQEEESWNRLKACANPECRWVYYDRSRNQQGNWCDMAVCGNRLKNRRLRARRR